MLFLFKVAVSTALVGLVSLIARRWGPMAGGLLMGLPWMTGPVLFFLGLDRGDAFAAQASVGALLGTVGLAVYLLAFALTARRASWPWAVAASALAFMATGAATSRLGLTLPAAGAAAAASLVAAYRLMPRPGPQALPRPLPWWDIPMRMAATAVLVAAITLTADLLGPKVSGIVATFPVISTVVGAFTLARWGADALSALARGIALSLLSFTAFFVVTGSTAERWGLAASFAAASLAALLTSGAVILSRRLMARRKRRREAAA